MAHQRCGLLYAALILGMVCLASAGITLKTDTSSICAQNLQLCQQTCPPPAQNFIFTCDSGGAFGSPEQKCDCVQSPGPSVDGVGSLQLFQYSGADQCAGNQWIFNCAQQITAQISGGNLAAGGSSAASLTSTPSLSPTTAACSQNIQGVVNGPNSAIIKIPTFDVLGTLTTSGTDTVAIMFGGPGTSCTAGFKLTQGTFLNLGRAAPAAVNGTAPGLGMGMDSSGLSVPGAMGADGSSSMGTGAAGMTGFPTKPAPGQLWSRKDAGAAAASIGRLLLAVPAAALLLAAL